MFNQETTRQIILILYGVLLGTLGNLLYRVNNQLKINPMTVRALNGALSLAIYILLMILSKGVLKLDIVTMIITLFIGYFVELIIEVLEDKIPEIIERIADKYLGSPPKKDK